MRIEILDHKAISWNQLYKQGHWSERSSLAKQIHRLVAISCIADFNVSLKTIKKKVDISIIAHYKDKRRRDSDNVCAKLYLDGLKEKGIIKDDDTRYVGKVTTEAKIGQKENKVVIKIT